MPVTEERREEIAERLATLAEENDIRIEDMATANAEIAELKAELEAE